MWFVEVRRRGEVQWTPVSVSTGVPSENLARRRFEATRAELGVAGASFDAIRLRHGASIIEEILARNAGMT